jgi:hypothetical protein
MTEPRSNEDSRTSIPPVTVGPRTLAFLWSCAGVSTSYVLGASALERPLIGIPAGLWLIAGTVLGTHALTKRSETAERGSENSTSNAAAFLNRAQARLLAFNTATGLELPRWEAMENGLREVTRLPARTAQMFAPGVSRLIERRANRPVTVKVGVDLSESDTRRILGAAPSISAASGVRLSFVRVPAGALNTAREDLSGLDGLIRRGSDGDLFVFVPESPSHPASWFDWSIQPPLSFATVFPTRLDCAQVEFGRVDLSTPGNADLVAGLSAAAAVLSRSPHRVSGSAPWRRRALSNIDPEQGPVAEIFGELSRRFEAATKQNPAGLSDRTRLFDTAARIVSAWALLCDRTLPAERREHIAQLASEGLEQEPTQVLRLAAAQFAAGDDNAGLRSLLWARRCLRSSGAQCAVDPLAFIQSEIEHGRAGGLSIGRVAAGLALLWGTGELGRGNYLRDDIADDLRHSNWLAGRDQDIALIDHVMNELDSAEHQDSELLLRRAA